MPASSDNPFANDDLNGILRSPDANPFTPGVQKPVLGGGNTSTSLPPPKPSGPQAGDLINQQDVYRGESRILSAKEIAEYAYEAGFRGQSLVTAVAVALAESSGRTGAFGPEQPNTPENRWMYLGGNPRGLWQIIPSKEDSGVLLPVQGPLAPGQQRKLATKTGPRDARKLFDPAFNARSTYELSNGGADWSPWTTYKKGTYAKYLNAARSGVAEANYATVPGVDGAQSNGVPTVDPAWTNGALYPLRLGAAAKAGELGKRLVGGGVDLSIKQPSQLTLELDDPDLTLITSGKVKPGTRIALNTDKYTILEPGIIHADTGARITATALRAEVVTLMHTDPPTISNIYPYDYVGVLAKAAGLTLAQTGRRAQGGKQDIAPKTLDEAEPLIGPINRALNPYAPPPPTGKTRESGWDIINRLASDYGYDVYLIGTTLYWAPVTGTVYLAPLNKAVTIAWPGRPTPAPAGALRALTIPKVDFTSPAQGRYGRATASFTLAPEQRFAVTPGQTVDLGLGALLTRTTLTATGVKLPTFMRCTRVNWPVADLTAPVTVEAETAVDVVIDDSTADDVDTDETGTSATAQAPAASLRYATPVPGTAARAVTPEHAVANALRAVGGACEPYSCMHTVGVWYGLAYSGWPLAYNGWYGTPAPYRHAGDYNAPPGALYYWEGGSAGHVALSTGSGYCVSTDWPVTRRVGQTKASTITSTWNKPYLGWTMPYFPKGG